MENLDIITSNVICVLSPSASEGGRRPTGDAEGLQRRAADSTSAAGTLHHSFKLAYEKYCNHISDDNKRSYRYDEKLVRIFTDISKNHPG